MSDNGQPPKAVRIDSWGFQPGSTTGRSRIPLFGVFLIVFGVLLAAGQVLKVAQLGASALFLALGIVLLILWLRDHNDAALYFGLLVTALALSDLDLWVFVWPLILGLGLYLLLTAQPIGRPKTDLAERLRRLPRRRSDPAARSSPPAGSPATR